jgi:zinc protease
VNARDRARGGPWRALPGGVVAAVLAVVLAVVAAVAPAGVAHAQSQVTPPLPGPVRPLHIEAPSEQVLANGMRVVVAPRRGVQLVTAQLVVLSGGELDPAQRAGLAAMTAAMLTKGTARRTAPALARAAESLGGTLDSRAGWHQSSVAITVSAARLDAALDLLGDTVEHPRFAQDEWERLRAQTLDELKVAYAQPAMLAATATLHEAFGAGPYGHPGGGTPTSLARITRAQLVALHRDAYRPDNAVLVLSGDLDPATGARLARRHFGAWRRAPHPGAAAPGPERLEHAPAQTVVVDMPDAGQAAVALAVPMPALGEDRATAAVVNAVLGGGYSSRLNLQIRVQRGLSYSAGSQLDARRQASALRVMVQTQNASAGQVLALVQAELDRLVDTAVPAPELDARKATLIGEVSRSVETTEGLGAAVQALLVAGRPLSDLSRRIEAISAVSAADVQRFCAERLGARDRVAAIAGEYSLFSQALKDVAPSVTVVPLGAFGELLDPPGAKP